MDTVKICEIILSNKSDASPWVLLLPRQRFSNIIRIQRAVLRIERATTAKSIFTRVRRGHEERREEQEWPAPGEEWGARKSRAQGCKRSRFVATRFEYAAN